MLTVYDDLRWFVTLTDNFTRFTWMFFMKIKDKMVKHIKNFVTLMKTDCSDYFLKCLHTDFECNINKLKEWLEASSKRSERSDLWILCSSSELLRVVTITYHRQMHSERFCLSQNTIHNMCWIHLFQSSDIHWLNCICHFTCQGHTLC